MNKLLLGSGLGLLALSGACFASLLAIDGRTWADVVAQAAVLGFLAVAVVVAGFVLYPLAQAAADVKRCKECPEKPSMFRQEK